MKKENKYTYIKVHKDLTKQLDSKFEGRTTFNVMHIPNGVEIGNKDLSGGIINPILMYEDKYNKNMMTAQYNKEYLEENYTQNGGYKGTAQEIDDRVVSALGKEG